MQDSITKNQFLFEYTLNIPGRMRIKNKLLKNNEEMCSSIMQYLSQMQGIVMASANQYTGKLLVIYNVNTINAVQVQEKISCFFNRGITAGSTKSKVIRADFKSKTLLRVEDYYQSRNVLSNEYRTSWHTLSVERVEKELNTDIRNGLTAEEVQNRLKKYGFNNIYKKKNKSFFSILLDQFKGFSTKLLFAAAGASFIMGQLIDAATILVIVGVEAVLGVLQEYKADKSLESLKQLTTPAANLIRNGSKLETVATHIVPGDIICLKAGDSVPADARIVEGYNLEVMEASLTGESQPVPKQPNSIKNTKLPLAERSNMVYTGTLVARGKGKAVVVGTGMSTEIGKIAEKLIEPDEVKTPLQKDLDRASRLITMGCIGICGIITLGGVMGGYPLIQTLSTGVTLAVGAIPEGLTTVLAISLAFAARRMASKNAIVKTLPTIESLSCMGVICTDKTGTLTRNEMTVKEIYTLNKLITVTGEGYNNKGEFICGNEKLSAVGHKDIEMILTSAALCNNSEIIKKENHSFDIKGDPTEAAFLVAVEKSGMVIDDFSCYNRDHEIPFDSHTRKMAVICSNGEGEYYAFAKGAVDTIIPQCTKIMNGNSIEDIDDKYIQEIMNANENMTKRALRVLGFAYKPLEKGPVDKGAAEPERDMVFLGLMGVIDPPRPEVKSSILRCHQAGIKVVMITGDHVNTAAAIASSIGLLKEDGRVLSGEELDSMSEGQLEDVIDKIQVFARTSPQQKLKIVKAFRKKGNIVAMTGDGVNDAPALKEADISFAMGKSGTDITKDTSSIILTDDNFSTIVGAIEEGRTVNRNIKKFVKFVLGGNMAEVVTVLLASVSGVPTPLLPVQILMLNLVTEGIPALSLGVDPPEEDVMKEPPRDPGSSIFDTELRQRIVSRGVTSGITTLGLFGGTLYLTGSLVKARTMAFTNLVSSQMIYALECSSGGIDQNRYLIPSVGASFGILLASIYLPPLNAIFGLTPLNMCNWAVTLFSALIPSFTKDIVNRHNNYLLQGQ